MLSFCESATRRRCEFDCSVRASRSIRILRPEAKNRRFTPIYDFIRPNLSQTIPPRFSLTSSTKPRTWLRERAFAKLPWQTLASPYVSWITVEYDKARLSWSVFRLRTECPAVILGMRHVNGWYINIILNAPCHSRLEHKIFALEVERTYNFFYGL